MSKRRTRRHRKSTQSPPSMDQGLLLEVRQDQPGSSGAWCQEMSGHDTEELLEVTDDQIVEIVAEGAFNTITWTAQSFANGPIVTATLNVPDQSSSHH